MTDIVLYDTRAMAMEPDKHELPDICTIVGLWCLVFALAFFLAPYFWSVSNTLDPTIGFASMGLALYYSGEVWRRIINHNLNWHQN